ncbi:MAG: hypothetical protein VW443_12835, partial [Pseudomonadales bacterium]
AGALKIEDYSGDGDFYLTQYADDRDIIFQSDDGLGGVTPYLTLDGSTTDLLLSPPGNVGIGTTSPTQKLDISDTTPVLRLTDSSSGVIDTAIGTIEFYSADTSGNYPAVGASIKAMTESSFGSAHGLAFLTNPDSASPTERMRIDEQGNVGIGTDSPGETLHLVNGSGSSQLRMGRSGDSTYVEMGAGTNYAVFNVENNTTNAYDFQDGGTSRLMINALGNVGIGTTSPTQDLTIFEDSGDCNVLISSANGASQVFFGDDEDDNIGIIRYDHSDNSMRFTANTIEAMRIDSSGNVIMQSGNKLYFDSGVDTYIYQSSDNVLQFYAGAAQKFYVNTSGASVVGNLNVSGNSFMNYGLVVNETANDADLRVEGTSDTHLLLTDAANNRVGIGTASPGEKLEVSGNIKISSSSNYLQASNIQNLISGGTFRIKNYGGTSLAEFQDDGDVYIPGNVGIGTTAPSTKLHIYEGTGTTASSTGTSLFTLTNYVGADLNQQKTFIDFTLLDDNSNETPQVRIGAEVGHNGDANTQQKEGSGAFVVYTNNAESTSGDAGASLAERMRVDYQGNVGIGTTSPSAKLHVVGD